MAEDPTKDLTADEKLNLILAELAEMHLRAQQKVFERRLSDLERRLN